MTWRFIDTDKIDGYYSAALFESTARHVGAGEVDETILFWRVKSPAVYLGYHQYVEDEINEDYCTDNGIQVIRRVLGGGCGFCDENQILFSIIGREGSGAIPSNTAIIFIVFLLQKSAANMMLSTVKASIDVCDSIGAAMVS